jgi:hypothetical protein
MTWCGIAEETGTVAIVFTNRLLGAMLSTLFGRRFNASSFGPYAAALSISCPALRNDFGDLTRLVPMRPSQPLATSLPFRGAAMKITRPTSRR